MNCRFCKTPMLPLLDIPLDSDTTANWTLWECHACPHTVKSYEKEEDWYSILSFYNGHWYEVVVFYTDTKQEPPFISIYKYTTYKGEKGDWVVKSELIKELDIDPSTQITPQNIQSKLATILTFS